MIPIILGGKTYNIKPIQVFDISDFGEELKKQDIKQLKEDFDAGYLDKTDFYKELKALRAKNSMLFDMRDLGNIKKLIAYKLHDSNPDLSGIPDIIKSVKTEELEDIISTLFQDIIAQAGNVQEKINDATKDFPRDNNQGLDKPI